MTAAAAAILASLAEVARERDHRSGDPPLAARVAAVKAYQHRRFERTYADLLGTSRYEPAARFFLDELYGPKDFAGRDRQFARVIPAFTRLFSEEVVGTVVELAALHALSEQLDSRMGAVLDSSLDGGPGYAMAWRAVGQALQRQRQIDLMLSIGRALNRYTRKGSLRRTLHLMRVPAAMTGLGELQRFLEHGFDAFGAMRGADEFLETIAARERRFVDWLFSKTPGDYDWLVVLGEPP